MPRLKPGSLIPDFEAKDQDGRVRRSADYRGRWVVLYFYPRDRTPTCTAEACAFEAERTQFDRRRAAVLGVSAESASSHADFARRQGLQFPLLDDEGARLTRAFGVALPFRWTRRVTFLIDPAGRVADSYWNERDGPAHTRWALAELDRRRRPE